MRNRPKTVKPLVRIGLILPLLLLGLTGCAGKPWKTPVADQEQVRVTRIFEEMQEQDAFCFGCMEAKASLFWQGPGKDRSISGYLRVMLPASAKFVVTNPLGQPLYALVTDGTTFHSIDTTLKQSVTGEVTTLMRRYDVPDPLLSADWGFWLMGRLDQRGASIEAIREDESGRGVWITLRHPEEGALAQSHLLIEPTGKRLLTRVLVGQGGETLATFAYEHESEEVEENRCRPAGKITITDLPYGSRLTINLTEVLIDREFRAADFRLKVPANYEVLVTRERGRGQAGRQGQSED